MQPTNRRSRVPLAALASLLFVLGWSGPASAAKTITSEANVWFTPGVPSDNGLRLAVHISDDAEPPATTASVTAYLPPDVSLQGDGFPRCSLATIAQAGVEACPDGSQLGSGTIRGLVGAARAPVEFGAYVVNGSSPGGVIFHLFIPGSLQFAFEGQVVPSNDPAFGSMLVVPIPPELQQPVPGIYHAITDFDLLLHANAAGPYVAIGGCPPSPPGFKTVVSFNPAAPDPLETTATASCVAGSPPAVNPMPRRPAPPPAPPGNPPPAGTAPTERAAGAFRLKLKRKKGQIRQLRLTGVAPGARVSVRCLSRCGRRGAELRDSVRTGTVRLRRALRPRSRFEVRVGGSGLVTRFARYRVDRRGRTAVRTKAGCLDGAGAARTCPAAV
jgi:hypothetical protein